MRVLFRLDLGGELCNALPRAGAQGLGHATRSLALAEALRDELPEARCLFAVHGPEAAAPLFDKAGFDVRFNLPDDAALQDADPGMTVLDLNAAGRETVDRFARKGPVINLAARGLAKFYADVTFNNTAVEDRLPPPDARPVRWLRGPRFALIGKRFQALRAHAQSARRDPADFSCLVSMGGIDQAGMTGFVVRALAAAPDVDFPVTVVTGRLNPHLPSLQSLVAERAGLFRLLVEPPDYPHLVANAAVGIFGMGGTTDEALSLGVPSLNLGPAGFHDLRGAELEAAGVIAHLGRFGRVDPQALVARLLAWRQAPSDIEAMRQRALALFDGQGCARVAREIAGLLRARPADIREASAAAALPD